MEFHTPPIGASMLHLLGGTSTATAAIADTTTAVPATRSSTDPPRPLHAVSHAPCLLRSHNRNSILLQGPPKSGKTSLAMDLAYSSASSAVCLGGCGGSSSSSCSCVAAILYRTADAEQDYFPLQCLVKEEEANDFMTRYQQLGTRNMAVVDDWDPRILQRIRIRYVQSMRDVLADLLAIPLMQQPLGAIIMDDIDRIASKETNPNSATMQLLAVAVDTSQASSHLHGTSPIVLATLEGKAVATPWMEAILTIQSAEKHIQWTVSPELLTLSKWKVTEQEQQGRISSSTEYVIANSPARGPRIHWRKVAGK